MFLRVTLVCLFFAATLVAQDLSHPLSVAECIDVALENHPKTKLAWWAAKRKSAALGLARSRYYPKVDLTAHADQGRDYKFLNGPDTSYTNLGANLTLSMMLFDFGERMYAVDAAASALRAAKWQSAWTMQGVMVSVLEHYFLALHGQERVEAAQISLDEVDKIFEASKDLHRAGLKSITDMYEAESLLLQKKMALAEEKSSLLIAQGKLAKSMGLDFDCEIHLAPIEMKEWEECAPLDELIALAKGRRADLLAKEEEVIGASYRTTSVYRSHWPKFSFNTRGGYNRYFKDKAQGAQYQVSLNFELPLFSGFQCVYQNRLAEAEEEMTKEELMELELDMALEILTFSQNVTLSLELLGYAETSLHFSELAYLGVLEKYRAGKESIFDLSQAERGLANARLRYSEVKTKLLVSTANLAYATGILESSCP